MAYLSKVTLGTGTKVSVDYQSEDVSLMVSWELERADTDLIAFVAEKAVELEEAHTTLRQRLREKRAERKAQAAAVAASSASSPKDESEKSQPQAAQRAQGQAGTHSSNSRTPRATQSAPPPSPPSVPPSPPATPPADGSETVSPARRRAIQLVAQRLGWSDEDLAASLLAQFNKETLEALTSQEANTLLAELQRQQRELNTTQTGGES